jgi:lauroyl/myristoyl acyltransferase
LRRRSERIFEVTPMDADAANPPAGNLPTQGPAAPAAPRQPAVSRAALASLFWLSGNAPWLLRMLRPIAIHGCLAGSAAVRHGTAANARRLLGPGSTRAQQKRLAKNVVGHFFDFVIDVAAAARAAPAQLRARIDSVDGRERYLQQRKSGGGAIVVTAHLGSFEVGLAMLTEVEPHVHVVFKRDQLSGFESLRRALRKNLGVHEAAIDDGWDTWLALRDALAANHVVVMQADRALPGQRAQAVPMLGGHLRLPLGPITLAQLSVSPIIPVFAIKLPSGNCKLFAEAPIWVSADAPTIDGVHPALAELGRVIEKYVAAYPQQWLILSPAFVEDADAQA